MAAILINLGVIVFSVIGCILYGLAQERKAQRRVEETRAAFRDNADASNRTISTLQVALTHLLTRNDDRLKRKIVRREADHASHDDRGNDVHQTHLDMSVAGRLQRSREARKRDAEKRSWRSAVPKEELEGRGRTK